MEPSIIQQNGYVWIALPREGILPFTILEQTEEGWLKRIKNFFTGQPNSAEVLHANLFDLFHKPGRGKVPKQSQPKEAAFFKGHDILNVNSDVAAKTLEGLSMLAKGKASSQLQISTKLLFSFKNVKQIHVDNEILFREFIGISKPSIESEDILKKLQKEKLFVISEILQTTDFTVRDASDFEFTGNLQVETIEKFASLKTNISAEKEADLRISYNGEGKPPITFALKAYRILYKEGKEKGKGSYSLDKTALKIVRGEQETNADRLEAENGIVWID